MVSGAGLHAALLGLERITNVSVGCRDAADVTFEAGPRPEDGTLRIEAADEVGRRAEERLRCRWTGAPARIRVLTRELRAAVAPSVETKNLARETVVLTTGTGALGKTLRIGFAGPRGRREKAEGTLLNGYVEQIDGRAQQDWTLGIGGPAETNDEETEKLAFEETAYEEQDADAAEGRNGPKEGSNEG